MNNDDFAFDIVKLAVEAAGADGLCRDGCGCAKDEICAMEGIQSDCQLAWRGVAPVEEGDADEIWYYPSKEQAEESRQRVSQII